MQINQYEFWMETIKMMEIRTMMIKTRVRAIKEVIEVIINLIVKKVVNNPKEVDKVDNNQTEVDKADNNHKEVGRVDNNPKEANKVIKINDLKL